MRRLVFLVVLLATSGPAFAEQRLFVRMPHEVVELDPRPASVGTVVRRFALPENARTWLTGRTYVVGGGDYLAWMTGYLPSGQRIVVLDTRTGTVHLIPAPGVYLERVLGTDGVGRVVFLASGATPNLLVAVADARTASLRVIDIGNPVGFTQPVAYAPESDLLFVWRARGIGPDNILDVDVIHLASGGLVKTLDLAPVSADVLETDDGGARLFVTDALNGTFVFDVASARRLAANTADDAVKSAFRSPALDEIRNRLIVNIEPTLSGFGDAIGISAFSADTLQFLGRIRLPELPLPPADATDGPGADTGTRHPRTQYHGVRAAGGLRRGTTRHDHLPRVEAHHVRCRHRPAASPGRHHGLARTPGVLCRSGPRDRTGGATPRNRRRRRPSHHAALESVARRHVL